MTSQIQFDRVFDGRNHREEIAADLGGGFTAVATLEHESVTTPSDWDEGTFTAEELAGYEAGDWYYGTVTLRIEFRGERIAAAGCIGGIEIHPDDEGGFAAATEAAEELLEECDTTKMVAGYAKRVARAAKRLK
jgi:hypothetical protein